MIDLERPSVSAVREACRLFHEENEAEERALRALFLRFRKNSDAAEVILKVVAVNSIYSTNVFAFRELAKQLHACSAQLDPLIEARDLAAFDLIEYLNLPNKKPRSCYSFASKYLSWHEPDVYPIYDSRVERYLCWLAHTEGLSFKNADLWRYAQFRAIIDGIRVRYGLQQFSYKQLDAFFYQEGGRLL